MRKFLIVLFLVFSVNFLFSDVPANIYELWLETTEKPEKVKIGLLVQDEYGLLPECENCENCGDYDSDDERCRECEEVGCGRLQFDLLLKIRLSY